MSALPLDIGPYASEQQAADTCRGIYQQAPTLGYMDEANRARLLAACEAAGIELGAYDRSVLAWLARWEPETVTAVAGMLLRAGRGAGR